MSAPLIAAAGVAAVTLGIHVVLGQIDPVRPLLATELDPVAKQTMLAAWHIVSVVLLVGSLALGLAGAGVLEGGARQAVALLLGLSYVGFAAVFLVIGLAAFGGRGTTRLPQWTLLLPVGALALSGAL